MIKKLLNLIYEALGRMMGYKSITDAFELDESVVSDAMSDSMDLWKSMYKDAATLVLCFLNSRLGSTRRPPRII